MRPTCPLVLAVWFLTATAVAVETAPLERAPEDMKKLLDLPEASQEEYARVEGTWELVQDTDEPRRERRVKTHRAGKTNVTVYDADGNLIGQHNSEYRLKKSGMARIFVFFKIVPATGPSKGREFPGPFYYAYSVQGDRFIEAYGLLDGDDRSPRMIFWNRIKTVNAVAIVTYKGAPFQGATVIFKPAAGQPTGASGLTDASGKAVLRTCEASDGVIPGVYEVIVSGSAAASSGATGAAAQESHGQRQEAGKNPTATPTPAEKLPEGEPPAKSGAFKASGLKANVTETGPNVFMFSMDGRVGNG